MLEAPGPGAATIEHLALQTDNPELKAQAERLEDELYGMSDQKKEIKDWSAKRLYKAVVKSRKLLHKTSKTKLKQTKLQPLNPTM